MNGNDDIPVLAALREQLVAGIAERTNRRRRLPVAVTVGVVAAVALVAIAVAVSFRPTGDSRQVIVRTPAAGQPQPTDTATIAGGAGSTTTVTAASTASPTNTGQPAPTTRPVRTTTTVRARTTPPAPATITIGVSDRNRTIAVTKGSTVIVQLDGDSTAIWPTEATSADQGVLRRISGSTSPTGSVVRFLALRAGTVEVTATGEPPCSVQPPPTGPPLACPAIAAVWAATVTVSG